MYQAYVVQDIGGKNVNVILGDEYETTSDAARAIQTYKQYFGSVSSEHIEQAGTPIPVSKEEKWSLLEKILFWFM